MGPMPEASGSAVADESDYSTFENKTGLAEDMKFLASMPELCDVTFLVGDTREPVCAVKAVLAARSRFACKIYSGTITWNDNRTLPPHIVEFSTRCCIKRRARNARKNRHRGKIRSGSFSSAAPSRC